MELKTRINLAFALAVGIPVVLLIVGFWSLPLVSFSKYVSSPEVFATVLVSVSVVLFEFGHLTRQVMINEYKGTMKEIESDIMFQSLAVLCLFSTFSGMLISVFDDTSIFALILLILALVSFLMMVFKVYGYHLHLLAEEERRHD